MRARRVGLFVAGVVCCAALIGHAPPNARADTVTLGFTDVDGNVDAVAWVSQAITVTTDLAAPAGDLRSSFRPAGGAACAPSAFADSGTEISSLYDMGVGITGPFSFDSNWIFPAPGLQMICIWVDPAVDESDKDVVTPIVQMVSLRPATGTISASEAPATEPAIPATTVTVAGSTDLPVVVRATYRPAGGAPCAATYAADPGTTFVDAPMITSGHFSFVDTIPFTGGTWIVCSWLETNANPPVAFAPNAPFIGPSTSTFVVDAPMAPAPAAPSPPAAPTATASAAKTATRIRSTFPRTARHLRLSVSSRVTASAPPAGTCWLEVLDAGTWKAPGAHARVTATGTCVVNARLTAPGRKRVRVEFRPSATFARADSLAGWVEVTR